MPLKHSQPPVINKVKRMPVTAVAIFFIFLGLTATAQTEIHSPLTSVSGKSGTIIVNITDLKKPVGMLGISLHNSKKGFPGKHDQAVANLAKKITGTAEQVVFENIPHGSYAISVVHDENSNGKLDKNFIGIPKEGVGVSNNPKIGIGGPKFDPCAFILNTGELELTIVMIYL